MKADDYEEKYNRFMRLEKLKSWLSCALGFITLFSFLFCVAFVLYFCFVDLIFCSFALWAKELDLFGLAAFLISPVCRGVVCAVVALLAIFLPK